MLVSFTLMRKKRTKTGAEITEVSDFILCSFVG